MNCLTQHSIEAARRRIGDRILQTPTIAPARLSRLVGQQVALKLENLQMGGSFKRRGVLNRLLTLSPADKARRLVAVSGGNFGIALAEVGAELMLDVVIVLPRSAPGSSAMRIEAAGAEVIWTDCVEAAFERAERLSGNGDLLIDDCDDTAIAAGSGTLALEFLEAHPDLTDILVSVGGGSMISGVCVAARSRNPNIRIWGVETFGADAMSQAIAKGGPVKTQVTSAISTLGVPEVSQLFYDHCSSVVEKIVLVTDAEAFAGVTQYAEMSGIWAEPAAGATFPALAKIAPVLPADAAIGVLICGGNASFADVAASQTPRPE